MLHRRSGVGNQAVAKEDEQDERNESEKGVEGEAGSHEGQVVRLDAGAGLFRRR
jgi:hypothetical protein